MTRLRVRVVWVFALSGALGAAPAVADLTPDPASAESARKGAAYLAGEQRPDGAIEALTSDRADYTAEAIIALVAGGGQEGAIGRALDYVADQAEYFLQNQREGGRLGRIISGLVAAGEDPTSFAGVNWVAELEGEYDSITGSYNSTLYGDALAMLGRLAAGETLDPASVTWLRTNQCPDGGWVSDGSCVYPDTDATALAISVIAFVAGPDDGDVREGRQWLLQQQTATGCWAFSDQWPTEKANSCGLALSAIVALGEDPGAAPWTEGDRDPLARLRDGFQRSDGGFSSAPGGSASDNYATIQAVPGVAHWSYPVSAPEAPGNGPRSPTSTTTSTEPEKQSSGGGVPTTIGTGPKADGAAGMGSGAGGDGDGQTTSSTTKTRVLGKTTGKVAWPVLGDLGADHDPLARQSGQPPDLVAREVGDDGSGVGAAGVLATGALASVGFGLGTFWWRRRGLGLL